MSASPLPSRPNPPGAMKCPICGKPTDPRHRPFCGRRCAEVDLGRWLGEAYRLPAEEAEAEPEEP